MDMLQGVPAAEIDAFVASSIVARFGIIDTAAIVAKGGKPPPAAKPPAAAKPAKGVVPPAPVPFVPTTAVVEALLGTATMTRMIGVRYADL